MIEIVPAYDRLDDIRVLLSEYTDMLLSMNYEFRIYLELQKYDDESLDPSMKYAMPDGRLYLAMYDGRTAGCIALHRLDETSCEMKRLYASEDVNDVDGVKISFESRKEWVHLRKSNTEPIIRIYAESSTEESAVKLAQEIKSIADRIIAGK